MSLSETRKDLSESAQQQLTDMLVERVQSGDCIDIKATQKMMQEIATILVNEVSVATIKKILHVRRLSLWDPRKSSNQWSHLIPTTILASAFNYVSPDDKFTSVSLVCKSWATAMNHPLAHVNLELDAYHSYVIDRYAPRFTRTTSLKAYVHSDHFSHAMSWICTRLANTITCLDLHITHNNDMDIDTKTMFNALSVLSGTLRELRVYVSGLDNHTPSARIHYFPTMSTLTKLSIYSPDCNSLVLQSLPQIIDLNLNVGYLNYYSEHLSTNTLRSLVLSESIASRVWRPWAAECSQLTTLSATIDGQADLNALSVYKDHLVNLDILNFGWATNPRLDYSVLTEMTQLQELKLGDPSDKCLFANENLIQVLGKLSQSLNRLVLPNMSKEFLVPLGKILATRENLSVVHSHHSVTYTTSSPKLDTRRYS